MRYVRTILLAMVAAGLILSAGCGLFGKKKAKVTILGYYDGNNNIDEMANGASAAIAEAQELEKVGSTDAVQIFAMIGAKKTGGQCKTYHVEKRENELPDQFSSPMLENLGTKDMSDKRTLKDFIIQGRKLYPAERYVLILFDHGGGWRGCCWDEVNGAGSCLTMPDLREALDTFHFDIIKFDMCLMAMAEVAYEIRDHATYMFGCQFVSRPHSFGSGEWLAALSADPKMAAEDLGKKMVQAAYNANIANQYTGHNSLIKCAEMVALASKLGEFGTDLVTLGFPYGEEIVDALARAHNGDLDDPSFFDLREICKNMLQEPNLKEINKLKADCEGLIASINDAVPITMTANTTVPRGGICIHFPYTAENFDSANYVKLQWGATNWHSFLSKLIAALGGGGGGKGSIHIVSNPAGAEIWVDGNDLGGVTPATVNNVEPGTHAVKLTLSGYQDWNGNVDVVAGQTAQVNATMQQGGGGATTVSGTASWNGHQLTSHCIAMLDTSHGSNIIYIASGQVNPSNGAFAIDANLTQAVQTYVDGWDDADNSGNLSVGDGLGCWDRDGNDTLWSAGDMFTLHPGDQVTNANVTLLEVSDDVLNAYRKRFVTKND